MSKRNDIIRSILSGIVAGFFLVWLNNAQPILDNRGAFTGGAFVLIALLIYGAYKLD